MDELIAQSDRLQHAVRTYGTRAALGAVELSPDDSVLLSMLERLKRQRINDAKRDRIDPDIAREMLLMLDTLSASYLRATPEQCAGIRDLAASDDHFPSWMERYAGLAADKVYDTKCTEWLLRSLAAISIIDQNLDFRDEYMTLAGIYLTAWWLGIDPQPYFLAVGNISNPNLPPTFAQLSTREMIAGFHTHPVFREVVVSKLAEPPPEYSKRLP